ncbi:MAG: hypothetical protein JWM97_2392 [Phycisphaerales bacterium]|nr:hypothetical protein [Phycisphaerales bacterium]MDB5304843.1 hypothetical protein [Phycisphaerales bacterium]
MSPASAPAASQSKAEHDILFQTWFKSVGPRTYAAQLKRAANGNHFLVLTEGKRDDKTEEVRKTRLFVFSEDFVEFFKMLHDTAVFIKANPVPEEVKNKRNRFWSKQNGKRGDAPSGKSSAPAAQPRRPGNGPVRPGTRPESRGPSQDRRPSGFAKARA